MTSGALGTPCRSAAGAVINAFVVKGVIVDGAQDHYARLEAAKLVLRLISSRRQGGANTFGCQPPRPANDRAANAGGDGFLVIAGQGGGLATR